MTSGVHFLRHFRNFSSLTWSTTQTSKHAPDLFTALPTTGPASSNLLLAYRKELGLVMGKITNTSIQKATPLPRSLVIHRHIIDMDESIHTLLSWMR